MVLNIKKKWRRPGQASVLATAAIQDPSDIVDIEEIEQDDEELRQMNAPARNQAIIPPTIPREIPYTRQGLFDLLKFMEYHIDREVYEEAWRRLKTEFNDQAAIITYLSN